MPTPLVPNAIHPSVAVIGAGLSGLICAQELRYAGIDVQVFEAQAEAGGRLATEHCNWALLDQGAQYFTARDPGFQAQVRQWIKAGWVEVWDMQPHRYFEHQLQPSPDRETRYLGSAGMQQLARELAAPLPIHYQHRVQQIEKRDNQYVILTDKVSTATARTFTAVVLALPPKQCQALLAENSRLSIQLKQLTLAPVWSVALGFEREQMPRMAREIAGIFVQRPELTWVSHNSHKPMAQSDRLDSWILHFSPGWSQANTSLPTGHVQQAAHELLSQVLQQPLPVVTASSLRLWPEAKLLSSEAPRPFADSADDGIVCCGDWAQGGRIEGAYLSGRSAAAQMLNLIGKRSA